MSMAVYAFDDYTKKAHLLDGMPSASLYRYDYVICCMENDLTCSSGIARGHGNAADDAELE